MVLVTICLYDIDSELIAYFYSLSTLMHDIRLHRRLYDTICHNVFHRFYVCNIQHDVIIIARDKKIHSQFRGVVYVHCERIDMIPQEAGIHFDVHRFHIVDA